MDKIKSLYQKFRLVAWIAIGVVILAIGFGIVKSQEKTDVLKDAELQFSGYEKQGSASVKSTSAAQLEQNLVVAVMKADKVDKSAIDYLKETKPSAVSEDKVYSLAGDKAAVDEAIKTAGQIDIKLTPNSSLKNGEKVTLKLDITKAEAKRYKLSQKAHTFKVDGLKKTTTVTANDIAKQFKFVFSGDDGYGTLNIINKSYANRFSFKVKNNGKLKNGDKLVLTLPTNLVGQLKYNGKIFSGSRSFTKTVTGLSKLGEVTNVPDVVRFNNEAADK